MIVPKYKWSKEVRRLWGNKCAYCGRDEKEWYIEAHHIMPKSVYPELATELENGVALCRGCHNQAHNGDFTRTAPVEEYRQSPYYKYHADVIEFVDSLINLVLPIESVEMIRDQAAAEGKSIDQFIKECVNAQHPGIFSLQG